jgi:hypothetical protein
MQYVKRTLFFWEIEVLPIGVAEQWCVIFNSEEIENQILCFFRPLARALKKILRRESENDCKCKISPTFQLRRGERYLWTSSTRAGTSTY